MTRSASRNEAIETLLLWEGKVSRARLLELFAMHETQASRDIASFRKAHPTACDYDLARKSYTVRSVYRPKLTAGDFASYQRLIGAAGSNEALRAAVPVCSTHQDATNIAYPLFREIHRAMREGHAINIEYRSLSTPSRHKRVIRPHALIQAGARWHLRAWCTRAQGYRDFNLGRISEVQAVVGEISLPGAEGDADWQTEVRVRLVPHRGLSPAQAQLVRDEYMGGTTAIVHTVRASMARYLIQAFRAAVDPQREIAPDHLLMVESPDKLPKGVLW
jgi:predicted DNA-binding transcriptional regulator YafY